MRTTGVLVLMMVLSSVPAYSVVPDIKKDCSICHVSHNMAGALKSPVLELCLSCHPDRKSPTEHAVDIAPSMTVKGLPLSGDGKLTCITCHEPHGKTGIDKMLRAVPGELCLRCHEM